MLKKIKEVLSRNKYKILAGASVVAAGYLLYHCLYDDRNIKLSTFLVALQSDQLDEVIINGDTIHFRSFASDWFHTTLGSFPLHELFQ